MYKILFSRKAENIFKKLPKPIQIRVSSSLRRIRIRPFSYVKKLVGLPYFRLRVGGYRVILEIRERELIILVIKIGLRKNVYQKI